jgi:hypothetical protein
LNGYEDERQDPNNNDRAKHSSDSSLQLPHKFPGAATGHYALVAFTIDLSIMTHFCQHQRSNTQKHLHVSGAAPERQVCEAHQGCPWQAELQMD